MNRRAFIKKAGHRGLMWTMGGLAVQDLLKSKELVKITILHTNDIHSRMYPFPQNGSSMAGLGGASRRAALIEQVRQTEQHVLLFDSGDIFQGTPYFNLFLGEPDLKIMSAMKYDAATLGNHDFDAGLDGLHRQLQHATFPFVISNYDFSDTVMAGKTLPYQVFQKGPVRIGVFGLGIELKGLVNDHLYKETRYLDPIKIANRYALILKEEEKCDLVVCLSHLGFKYDTPKVSDMMLAENSRNIDIILGGHTHTFMKVPLEVNDLSGHKVSINQVGWGGVLMGRYDLFFEPISGRFCRDCITMEVGPEGRT